VKRLPEEKQSDTSPVNQSDRAPEAQTAPAKKNPAVTSAAATTG
jgi:hypothetical protein